MANKPIDMSVLRQILKHYSQGIGKKKIARRLGVSKNTIKAYIDFFIKLGRPIDGVLGLSDHELNQLFHPPQLIAVTDRMRELQEYFPQAEKNLRRRGMTITEQHRQYKKLFPHGYGKTQFYNYYILWSKKIKVAMHIEHVVGDKTYVDFAGATLPYVDKETGEIKKAQVFVAILGWSQYAYVEALRSQITEEFITGSENALHYFKGATMAIVPDNMKSAVFRPNRYEPDLNENFRAFADHYGMAIVPARVRKPQDKAHVENMVKIVYQRIYALLPDNTETLTLEELNAVILDRLSVSNNTNLTGMDVSRTDRHLLEVASLQPLPAQRYQMRKIKQVTVMKNAHVYLTEDQHYYSVPYQLIGKKLKFQYSRSVVEIFDQYQLIVSHTRVRSPHNYTTDPVHMPPQHQQYAGLTPEYFIEKAKAIDPIVELYIKEVLARKKYPQQAFRSCQGILSFAKRVGHERLIRACKRGHEVGYYNYKSIEDILTRRLDQYEDESSSAAMPSHENIRGSNYYQ